MHVYIYEQPHFICHTFLYVDSTEAYYDDDDDDDDYYGRHKIKSLNNRVTLLLSFLL